MRKVAVISVLLMFGLADYVGQAQARQVPVASFDLSTSNATGLGISPNSHALVAIRSLNTVKEYDSAGAELSSRVLPVNTQFVDGDGTGILYAASKVYNSFDSTVAKVNSSNAMVWQVTIPRSVERILVSAGHLFVFDQPSGGEYGITVLNTSNGSYVDRLTESGEGIGYPIVDSDGDIVAPVPAGIKEYDPTTLEVKSTFSFPAPVTQWTEMTNGPGSDLLFRCEGCRPRGSDPIGQFGYDQYTRQGEYVGSVYFPAQSGSLMETAPDGSFWVFDGYGNSRKTLYRIDREFPSAQLEAPASPQETGTSIAFDASKSEVPFGQISNFEWDFDGDGEFDKETGTTSKSSYQFDAPGFYEAMVRVTSPAGRTAVANVNLDIRRKPRTGPVGVSINDGAVYTNDPNVEVHMRWPRFSIDALLSNDGGFSHAKLKPVRDKVHWKLVESGPERLPKTIYVRFSGGQRDGDTFQDDIILDQTPPVIVSAGASTGSSSVVSNHASAAVYVHRRFRRIRVNAKDRTSGVAKMQVTAKKSKPGKWKKYRRTVRVPVSRRLFVRVRDRAGNPSRWKLIRL